jgi:beta-carotene 3-hydroxylase
MRSVVVAMVAFAAMEPITAATHRFVMHGVGRRLHRSHHAPNPHGWELNDLYPVMFAALVMLLMAVGFNVAGFGVLVPVCVGATVYGGAYAAVHDVYIHRRLGALGGRRAAVLERLAAAHREHHVTNGAPFGMLMPMRAQRRSGSIPSQVPLDANG